MPKTSFRPDRVIDHDPNEGPSLTNSLKPADGVEITQPPRPQSWGQHLACGVIGTLITLVHILFNLFVAGSVTTSALPIVTELTGANDTAVADVMFIGCVSAGIVSGIVVATYFLARSVYRWSISLILPGMKRRK